MESNNGLFAAPGKMLRLTNLYRMNNRVPNDIKMKEKDKIQSIINGGGWCEVNPKNGKSISNSTYGRIVLNASDYLVNQNHLLNSMTTASIPFR
jgi:hypothetical protein